MPTATKAPPAPVEVSAQSIYDRARLRVDELEALAIGIDAQLQICESVEVTGLMDARRSHDDERLWLLGKLPGYEADANLEAWEQARADLNAKWKALAQNRVAATERLGEATRELVAAIESVNAAHAEQRQLLLANVRIDSWRPKNHASVQHEIKALDFGIQQSVLWAATLLRPLLPTHGRFAPTELVMADTLPFRDHVL